MCGLTGLFNTRPTEPTELPTQIRRMTASLVHRGPDDEGIWVDEPEGIALGFRRLAIVDLSVQGHQPMVSASGRFIMVFNGEVFNHRSLRAELEGSSPPFRGHSDTETILATFDRWGIAASIQRFVGMFALAVWDAERRELHLVRDRLGIKPLYYAWSQGRLWFGSELRSLMVIPEIPRDLDPLALMEYLRYLYVPAPRSIFASVRKLLPGHHLIVKSKQREEPTSAPYWSLPEAAMRGLQNRVTGNDEEVVAEFDRLLQDAVALRMEADVPLGALLSGGIDSSVVVAMMQAASTRPVQTFSIGFPGTEHDEAAMARGVAAHLGTDHHELSVDGGAALELVPRLASHSDEPLADPSQIPTLLVCELARRSVTVALTGDGGDELFGGYNRYLSGPGMIATASRVPGGARRILGDLVGMVSQDRWDQVYRAVAPLIPAARRQRLPGEKIRKAGQVFQSGGEAEMYRSLLSAWQHPTRLLAHPRAGADRILEALESRAAPSALLDRIMLADQMVYLPDDLLAKVDRMSMAVSLEARVPLLDHRVVEHSWRLRPEHKVRDGQGKWILRQVLYRRVPRALIDRPKTGFTAPIGAWLKGPLRPWAESHLSPEALTRSGLLDPSAVRRVWGEFLGGHSGHAAGIWAIVMLQAWYERWMSGVSTAS